MMLFKDHWLSHPFVPLVLKSKEDGLTWITVNGAHIPVKPGQSHADAAKEHLGNKPKKDPTEDEDFTDVANLAAKVPKIHPNDVKVMSRFIDAADTKDDEKLSGDLGDDAERLAQYWGINPDKGISHISSEFKRIFSGEKKVKPTLLNDKKP